jgi:uncharacterized protein (TIGR03437 family)
MKPTLILRPVQLLRPRRHLGSRRSWGGALLAIGLLALAAACSDPATPVDLPDAANDDWDEPSRVPPASVPRTGGPATTARDDRTAGRLQSGEAPLTPAGEPAQPLDDSSAAPAGRPTDSTNPSGAEGEPDPPAGRPGDPTSSSGDADDDPAPTPPRPGGDGRPRPDPLPDHPVGDREDPTAPPPDRWESPADAVAVRSNVDPDQGSPSTPTGPVHERLSAEALGDDGLANPVRRSVPASVRADLEAATGPAVTDFVVVNAASFEADSRPRGALLSVFTNAPVSDEDETFDGVETTPAGVSVEVANCTAGGPRRRLPIFYVGASGRGSQINVYWPNDVGREPYGGCTSPPLSAVFSTFTVHTADGQAVAERLTTNPVLPGIFTSPRIGHYETATGRYTSVRTCNQRPDRCPVSTDGERNYLIVWTTGGDLRSCHVPGFHGCDSPLAPVFHLTPVPDEEDEDEDHGDGGDDEPGTPVDQDLTYYGPDATHAVGVTQANLHLLPHTTPGEHVLTMTLPDHPTLSPHQEIPLHLGPPS